MAETDEEFFQAVKGLSSVADPATREILAKILAEKAGKNIPGNYLSIFIF